MRGRSNAVILSTVSRLGFLSCQLDLMGKELMGIQPFQTAALMSVLMRPLPPFFPPVCSHMPTPDTNIQIETASPSPYMFVTQCTQYSAFNFCQAA